LQGMNDSRQGTIVLNASLDSTRQFLQDISTTAQTVSLKGFQGTSDNEALAAGLMSLSTKCVIPIFHSPRSPLPERVERE
jgi:hypothetical protein